MMAALVQTYTQPAGTTTMLQSRPNSNQTGGPQPHRNSVSPSMPGSLGRSSTAPIQPYAFTSTPSLHVTRSTSAGGPQSGGGGTGPDQPRTRQNEGLSPNLQLTNSPITHGPWDEPRFIVAQPSQQAPQKAPVAKTTNTPDRYRRSSQVPLASPSAAMIALDAPSNAKIFDGRSTTTMNRPTPPRVATDDMDLLQRRPSDDEAKKMRRRSMHTLDSSDFMQTMLSSDFRPPPPSSPYRSEAPPTPPSQTDRHQKTLRLVPHPGQIAAHARSISSESAVSSRSNRSRPSSSTNRTVGTSSPTLAPSSDESPRSDKSRSGSSASARAPPLSSEVNKRVTATSSPLSQSTKKQPESVPLSQSQSQSAPANKLAQPAPAVAAVSAMPTTNPEMSTVAADVPNPTDNKLGKSKKKVSRLRRALSFGSAADFRKIAASEGDNESSEAPSSSSRQQITPTVDEAYDAEQAKIAQKQEEGGIGSSIYGGRFFAGSTDNLSISSTASSASIMIRKMGRGMKRSTRSLVGLFRPKSTTAGGGSPTMETPISEASQAAVSMITVEAEREKLGSTNAGPQELPVGGGLATEVTEEDDSQSIEAAQGTANQAERSSRNAGNEGSSRRSILGGDSERAEVLAAVRKGILKRKVATSRREPKGQADDDGEDNAGGFSSPTLRSVDPQASTTSLDLPLMPNNCDSPNSSAPSTPNDETQGGHKPQRNESVTIGNEDYFVAAMRLRQDTRSAPVTTPGTPQGLTKRSATFSPRIVFYDTWPSQEYDRRGEVATCNRLTPMLAQQIKEELNTFKMEMEVHENSKIYTHFF